FEHGLADPPPGQTRTILPVREVLAPFPREHFPIGDSRFRFAIALLNIPTIRMREFMKNRPYSWRHMVLQTSSNIPCGLDVRPSTTSEVPVVRLQRIGAGR